MISVRLAYNPGPVNAYGALANPAQSSMSDTSHTHEETSSTARTAELPAPALLVSYVYLAGFEKNRHRYHYRDWVLDSGAFSAHNSGAIIRLQDYIDTCKRLMDEDPTLTEVFGLDVIGDFRATMRNIEEMWRQGVPAIPCFHRGTPWPELKAMARDFPKIALGGVAMLRGNEKMVFASQAFSLIWPKKIHGFGFGSKSQIMTLPFHSVDATNWEVGPCRFGRWEQFGQMSVRGSNQNLRGEVEAYLRIEREAQFRWRKEMKQLADLDEAVTAQRAGASDTLTLRLAHSAQIRPGREGKIGLEPEHAERRGTEPSVRLSVGGNMRDDGEQRAEALAAPDVRLALAGGDSLFEKQFAMGLETPAVRLACCMSESEGGSWGVRNMTQALGLEHYVKEPAK
jgi:hypothetical protein